MLNQKLKALWIACGTEDPSHDDKITFGSTIIALAMVAVAQIKTEVPAVVRGAKPVAVEHIKIHGAVRGQGPDLQACYQTSQRVLRRTDGT